LDAHAPNMGLGGLTPHQPHFYLHYSKSFAREGVFDQPSRHPGA
jgi:hypothetical protein